ncbi:MAG: DMT family transporter [bacterium]
MSRVKIYTFAIVSMVFWALSFLWYKDAFLSYKPITVIFFRLILSVSILLVVSAVVAKKLLVEKKDYKWLALISFFEPFCYFIGEGFGMQFVSPTTGAIIIATIPLFTPFVVMLMRLKEKIHFTNLIGIAVSFAGILIVVTNENPDMSASLKGIALLFVAVFSAIFFSITLRKVGNKYSSMVIVFWQNLFATLYFLPLFIFGELQHFLTTSHKPEAYFAVIKLGIFPSTISFLLYIPVIAHLGASKANVFTNLIPVMTALFSFIYFGEEFSFVEMAGIAIVIIGIFFSQFRSLKTKKGEALHE